MADLESAEEFVEGLCHAPVSSFAALIEADRAAVRLALLTEIALKLEAMREAGAPLPMAIIAALNESRLKYTEPDGRKGE